MVTSLIWLFVMRFKRTEVQIVQDARESTHNIFRKIQLLRKFNRVTIIGVLVFQFFLMVYGCYFWNVRLPTTSSDLPPEELKRGTIVFCALVDLFIVLLTVGMILNLMVQILSLERMVEFIAQKSWTRFPRYLILIALIIFYLADIMYMML